MHARIDDLLSLRDAQPVPAEIAAHVAGCPACAAQLERLSLQQAQLQSLPVLDAPAHAWQQIQSRLAHSGGRPMQRRPMRWVAAAALAVLAIIASVAVRDRHEPAVPQMAMTAPGHEPQADAAPVADLVELSQYLDSLLQNLPERPLIERVSTAATIDTIEQRIQWLDFQLSTAPEDALSEIQARRLWHERVELMDSLVKVRYAEAGRARF